MFSRQHYQKFAEILKKMHGKDQELLATELITMFKQDNPRFNAELFAKAAGLEGNTRLHNIVFAHESASPTGGQKPFKVNEAFGGMKMKLGQLLPVVQLEARGTSVSNDPLEKMLNDKVLMELYDDLMYLEDTTSPKLENALMDMALVAKKKGMNLLPMKNTIFKAWVNFWETTRKTVDAEISKSKRRQ